MLDKCRVFRTRVEAILKVRIRLRVAIAQHTQKQYIQKNIQKQNIQEKWAIVRWPAMLWVAVFMTGVVLAEEVLSEAFIDYLLTFEAENGEWVDPEALEMMVQLTRGEEKGAQDED